MEEVFNELEEMIAKADQRKSEVSAKGVDWHLSHVLKALIGVNKIIKHSDPAAYKWKFNFSRTVVFGMNKIPRGKGRAPEGVTPGEVITTESLVHDLADARIRWQQILALSPRHNFNHAVFGLLNCKQTQRFIKIHTVHHLKIMRDIIS